MPNGYDNDGAYLNLGEGRYAGVGKENWKLIRNHIVNENGEYCKNNIKYAYYFSSKVA